MNQYRHSKSSLFLMEIILNILFFSILATFCVQIFFKGYQLSKSTEKLHQAVTACTSIAEICQSTDSPEETLSSIYPESMSLNETILIYYNKDFLACGKVTTDSPENALDIIKLNAMTITLLSVREE